MNTHEAYMRRCIELARLGAGATAPNPMVGAVLVHEDRIIGEGYHQQYGKAHAEPNCLASVKGEDRHLIASSTLYVSLEPCVHFGKTPPCADLIIENKIRKIIIGCRDPFSEVNGKGIEKLKAAGMEVQAGVLETECRELNRRFFTFHTLHRPYVILKWAATLDSIIGHSSNSRLLISNAHSNRMVHKWRSEEMSVLVGTNTALHDDPELTTRLWPGKNPARVVIDKELRLPQSARLFHSGAPVIIFNLHRHTLPAGISIGDLKNSGVIYYQVRNERGMIGQILHALHQLNIQSVLVEGGCQLLQSFIDEGIWDEARVITNEELTAGKGIAAPVLKAHRLVNQQRLFSDVIRQYKKEPLIN
jgi:diaminohydroxyphosphoribosylaminopyrimidine deaminase/5-amino-6-(5-phosphoribosylamino)uracil reductase